jgi:ABC-type transport system involved in multi-copper enzyme maturation permease subunit
MELLPVVQRELLAATRRKSTIRLRWWTVLVAILVSLVLLPIMLASAGRGRTGEPLFGLLTCYTFGLCLLAGVFLTADALSEERREGTVGLLFLTGLNGTDVVAGKFLAHGLNALYGLLGLLPITALPLLAGGVTGAEFWRTALALINALFVSLAAGICISAFSLQAYQAMARTFGLILFLAGGLPALAALATGLGWPPAALAWTWPSPLLPFASAADGPYAAAPTHYWRTLVASGVSGWLLLGLGAAILSRTWQHQEPSGKPSRWFRWRPGNSNLWRKALHRPQKRQPLRDEDPIAWLANRGVESQRAPWILVTCWAVFAGLIGWFSPEPAMFVYYGAKVFGFLLKLLIALEACRFIVEARRAGSLELLLCSSLRQADLERGHWVALKRRLLGPILVFLLAALLPFQLRLITLLMNEGTSVFWNLVGNTGLGIGMVTWLLVGFVLDAAALVWVGRWLSLSAKRPQWAPLYTVLAVLIVPSVAICGLDLLADLLLIVWAATHLKADWRWVIGGRLPLNHSPQPMPDSQHLA